MKEKSVWDIAGKAGLVLGAVSIAYMLAEQLWLQDGSGQTPTLTATFATIVLWVAKFVGCILLMRFFMRRYAAKNEGVTQRDARSCGTAIALTSALIYSAFVLAWSKFVDPEMFTRAFEQAAEQYSAFLDSNTTAMMEQMQDKMPVISFFSNFIYCFLYGTVLSSILSSRVGKDTDPFADGKDPFTHDNQ
ncbi:MAG: DUF4199 domain-containing protein [Bacteroidales bacterium]|nr:DUF4199 domain-containing protein [Bacteroidales bacterium]MBQ6291750.1 DUF4199 domain-containing protein [Bacteroidales bacterium]MBQ9397915.1 DUF4199 domain-containing protein [Bacteroidales bacterium]